MGFLDALQPVFRMLPEVKPPAAEVPLNKKIMWSALALVLFKRSGERVTYDRAKVILGVTKACEKRPVSLEEIETIVDRVEHRLATSGRREVPSEAVGTLVMDMLHEVDDVAYVRFASVYHSFRSIDEFFDLLRRLRQERNERR